MVTPVGILAPGGRLIIASECSEGLGSTEFREAQARLVELGPDAFLQAILQKPLADVDEWQTELSIKPRKVGRVQLYSSGLSPDEHRLTGVDNIGSVDRAIEDSIAAAHDDEIAIIPEGPYVVPFCDEAAA